MKSKLREILGELAGQASMCWNPIPKGVFDDSQATKAVDQAERDIQEIINCKMKEALEEGRLEGKASSNSLGTSTTLKVGE